MKDTKAEAMIEAASMIAEAIRDLAHAIRGVGEGSLVDAVSTNSGVSSTDLDRYSCERVHGERDIADSLRAIADAIENHQSE